MQSKSLPFSLLVFAFGNLMKIHVWLEEREVESSKKKWKLITKVNKLASLRDSRCKHTKSLLFCVFLTLLRPPFVFCFSSKTEWLSSKFGMKTFKRLSSKVVDSSFNFKSCFADENYLLRTIACRTGKALSSLPLSSHFTWLFFRPPLHVNIFFEELHKFWDGSREILFSLLIIQSAWRNSAVMATERWREA